MRLKRYLSRIQNILYSRKEITIEYFRVREIVPDQAGIIEGRLRSGMIHFWNLPKL
jgi:hypothetical protein